jgi:hypothetical protein
MKMTKHDAIQALKDHKICFEHDFGWNKPVLDALDMAIEALAADAVEVVRCGECKHCVEHYDTDGNAPYWVCNEWDSGTDYDGYCHYGEKKGGDGE